MSKISFPSRIFPDLPKINMETIDGWEGRNFPESLVGLIKIKNKTFSPNLLINIKKVGEQYSYDTYSKEVNRYLDRFQNTVVLSEQVQIINGVSWLVKEYTFIDNSLGPLAQIAACSLLPIDGAQFLVSFTGTASLLEEIDRVDYLELQKILRSVHIK